MFQRHHGVQRDVLDQTDLAHPAGAQTPYESVAIIENRAGQVVIRSRDVLADAPDKPNRATSLVKQ